MDSCVVDCMPSSCCYSNGACDDYVVEADCLSGGGVFSDKEFCGSGYCSNENGFGFGVFVHF